MKLRFGNLEALRCRRRNSDEMKPTPYADEHVIAFLENAYPKYLAHIEAWKDDIAKLEHSYWCLAGDWHVATYKYVVDDDTGKVYTIVKMEGS